MSAWPFQEMVQRIGQIQPPLDAGTSYGIGLAALAAVAFPITWQFVRYFNTMAHEGSHAVMNSLLGFKITGIWLRWKDADGLTEAEGPPGTSDIPSLLIGYVGPSVFGLAAAKLISIGHSVAVLWLAMALLVLLLASVQNVFGILAILLAGFVIFTFARYGTVTHETEAAYGIAWLLLFCGVRAVLMHWPRPGAIAGDAQILLRKTEIVPVVFSRIWLVATLFAVFLGARLMT